MTEDSNEAGTHTTEPALPLEIVPPEGAMIALLAGQGTQEPREYHTVLWTPPPGTTREQIGAGSLATFWRLTLPGGRQLLEVRVPALGLSILYDDGDTGDLMIS